MIAPVTLILGLGRDVGAACARYFHESGHRVLVASPDEAALKSAIDEFDGAVAAHHGDLHTMIGMRNALNVALETYNRIDNLVIIPALPEPASLFDIDMNTFDETTIRGARAATLALRLFAQEAEQQEPLISDGPERQRQTGTVTYVLSLSARLTSIGKFSESISQAAIEAVVQAGAVELAPRRIRINAVCAIRPRAEQSEPWLKTRTPLGRAALADEIAEAVGYIASPGAAIITGETLIMDGGRLQLGGVLE